MRWLIACLAALALVGCGGSDSLSREDVEATVGQQIRSNVGPDTAVDDPECVDAGGGEWKCIAYVRNGDQAGQVSVDVTCDEDGRCLFTPSALRPVP